MSNDIYRCAQLPKDIFVNVRTRHINFDRLVEWIDYQREKQEKRKKKRLSQEVIDKAQQPKKEPEAPPTDTGWSFSGACLIRYGENAVQLKGYEYKLLRHLIGCEAGRDDAETISAVVWGSDLDESDAISKCAKRINDKLSAAGIQFWVHQTNKDFTLEEV